MGLGNVTRIQKAMLSAPTTILLRTPESSRNNERVAASSLRTVCGHAGRHDDERAIREDDEIPDGDRAAPGPADVERMPTAR